LNVSFQYDLLAIELPHGIEISGYKHWKELPGLMVEHDDDDDDDDDSPLVALQLSYSVDHQTLDEELWHFCASLPSLLLACVQFAPSL
jgi:hypothetical protein